MIRRSRIQYIILISGMRTQESKMEFQEPQTMRKVRIEHLMAELRYRTQILRFL
jgi:hypothetical protein